MGARARRWGTGVAVAAAAAALVGGALAPAQAAAGSYVALGDSYSSGLGTRTYVDDGTECRRSPAAYASLLAASAGLDLDLRACSGATVGDVTANQLSALSAGTTHVTISIGGNDAGFADVLTECALPGWASDCDGAIDGAQAVVNGSLPGALDGLYAAIASRAPSAAVTVVGYPRIFMGEDCNALTFFSPEEEARLNAMADLINAMTASRAAAAGFSFADPTSAFVGHAVCDDPEWLNGFSNPVEESYHPNVAGHQGYAGVVGGYLGSPAVTAQGAATAASPQWAEQLAARQRPHAEADSAIEPEVVGLPDLHSPSVLAAASAAGVDVDDAASLAAGELRWSSVQQVEATTGVALD